MEGIVCIRTETNTMFRPPRTVRVAVNRLHTLSFSLRKLPTVELSTFTAAKTVHKRVVFPDGVPKNSAIMQFCSLKYTRIHSLLDVRRFHLRAYY